MDDNKKKVLSVVLFQIECQFGKGVVMCMGDQVYVVIFVILIGFLGLDIVLGIGGMFQGWIVEIYGFELFGKIMLMLSLVVQV